MFLFVCDANWIVTQVEFTTGALIYIWRKCPKLCQVFTSKKITFSAFYIFCLYFPFRSKFPPSVNCTSLSLNVLSIFHLACYVNCSTTRIMNKSVPVVKLRDPCCQHVRNRFFSWKHRRRRTITLVINSRLWFAFCMII